MALLRRAIPVTALAAITLIFCGCMRPGARAFLEGKKLLEQGKAPEAAEKFKQAAVLMPTNALAFEYLGLAAHQCGQYAEAERAYVTALRLDRDMSETHFNLGCLYQAQNKYEQAKSEFTAFTLRRSNSPEGFLKLGAVQLREREAAAAERSFQEALRLSPGNPEGLTGLGLTKAQRNRPVEALNYFGKALQERPGYRPALLNLAIVAQEQLHDRELALRHYKQLLALKPPPENASALALLVRSLEQPLAPAVTNKTQLVSATAAKPPPAPVALLAASAPVPAAPSKDSPRNVPSGAPARPSTLAATATAIPSNPPAAKQLAPAAPATPVENVSVPTEPVLPTGQDPQPTIIVAARTKPEFVTPPADTRISSGSDGAAKRGLLHRINPVRLFSGEEKQAAPTTPLHPSTSPAAPTPVPAAVETKAQFPRYTYHSPPKPMPGNRKEAERAYAQGVQAHEAERFSEAIQAYRQAIQLDPSFFNAHYNLALAAAASGNLPLALSSYEAALVLRPDYRDARYNFALVLKQANYPVDAASELEKVLATFPTDSRAHLALGNLYAQQLANPTLARQHYLKVLEDDPQNPQAAAIHYWLTDNRAR